MQLLSSHYNLMLYLHLVVEVVVLPMMKRMTKTIKIINRVNLEEDEERKRKCSFAINV